MTLTKRQWRFHIAISRGHSAPRSWSDSRPLPGGTSEVWSRSWDSRRTLTLTHSQTPRGRWALVWETQIDWTFPCYRQTTRPGSNRRAPTPGHRCPSVPDLTTHDSVKSRAHAWCVCTDEWVGFHQKPRNSLSAEYICVSGQQSLYL